MCEGTGEHDRTVSTMLHSTDCTTEMRRRGEFAPDCLLCSTALTYQAAMAVEPERRTMREKAAIHRINRWHEINAEQKASA